MRSLYVSVLQEHYIPQLGWDNLLLWIILVIGIIRGPDSFIRVWSEMYSEVVMSF
jgi:hypothetical protein